jgi:hypothetical protein
VDHSYAPRVSRSARTRWPWARPRRRNFRDVQFPPNSSRNFDRSMPGATECYYRRMVPLEIVGKVLLFLAGLPAVFDVIKPETLQSWSNRSTDRSARYLRRRDEYRSLESIANLRKNILRSFVRTHTTASWGHSVTTSHLVWTPPDDSPWSGMDLDEFTPFWRAVMDEVRKRFEVSKERSTLEKVRAATSFIEVRVDELLSKKLPPPERGLIARLDQYRDTTHRRGMRLLLTILGLLSVTAVAMHATPEIREWASRPVEGLAVPLVTLVFLLALMFYLITPIESPGAAEAAMLRVAARVLKGMASPVRPLRLTALALFITGSLLDLIAAIA